MGHRPAKAGHVVRFRAGVQDALQPGLAGRAPGYYESTIVGMAKYCDGFGKVSDTVSAIADYEQGTPLSGVSAPNPSTVVFRLVEPASDFINILAMGFSDARPVEYMKYLPDGAAFRQHTISDGPTRSRRTHRARASP